MKYRVAFVSISSLLTGWLTPVNAQTPSATPELNPTGDAGALKAQIQTAGSYDAHSGNATRIVNDLHVPGALGVYGLDFTRYWNSTHNDYDNYHGANAVLDWPLDFGASGWSHSWRWTATYEFKDPEIVWVTCGEAQLCESDSNQYTTAINITFPDGHITKYKIVRLGHGEWMVPGSYPNYFGPPYSTNEIQYNFPYGGTGVHDHLCNMAPNGSEFWLCRADGGSVHFVWNQSYGFQAREVFDPHGFRTALSYDANGNLEWVEPEGGRFLKINWAPYNGVLLIKSVQSGLGQRGTVNQTVRYEYGLVPGTGDFVLSEVYYENEPLPGGGPNDRVKAEYAYGTCWDGGIEPCPHSNGTGSLLPLLKRAVDPHFAGPMTTIRYAYNGVGCPHLLLNPLDHPDYIEAQPYAIVAERSETGAAVSRYELHCDGGLRKEYNGLGGGRTFYFGTSAETNNGGLFCRGFQLGKLTDFTLDGSVPPNVPFQRQNFGVSGHPAQIWDGRGIMTHAIYAGGDDSGEPAEIHRADTSVDYYNRVNPSASAQIDPAQGMHNPYNHWVFSETHQINAATPSHITTYTRDSRRRVIRIDYPGGSGEEYTYNNFNQVLTHTLPSGAMQHYDYDGLNQLWREWNSVDGENAATTYTYYSAGNHPEWTGLVATAHNARAGTAPYSTMMKYNGRQQITEVHYAPTPGSSDPHVTYGYDAKGNCTAITDELGHASTYEYDCYRRCISYTEPLNTPDSGDNNIPSRRWNWIYDRYIVDNNYNPVAGGYKDALAHTVNSWRIQVEPAFNYLGDRPMTHRFHDVNGRVLLEQTGWIQRADPAALGDWYWSGQFETAYYTYDENSQKKTYTDSLGRRTSYEYDLRNRLSRTNETENTVPRTTETLYDFAGNKTQMTFPDTRTQQWLDYDAFGQPWRFIDERNNTTNLTYCWGPMKLLWSVTTHRDKDGGGLEDQPTSFSYDLMGRRTQIMFPDGSDEFSTYEFGQLKSWQTRKDQVKTIVYDTRGRELSHSWSAGAAPAVTRSWDAANRLTSISNIFATINYTYDDAAQLLSESESISGAGGAAVTGYRRYGNGTIWNLIYPNGMRSARAYSPQLRLQTVWDHGPNNWQWTVGYTYTDDGKIDHEDYANGTTTAYGYDGRGMINSVQHKRGGGANLSARTYYRDNRDRVTAYQKSTANSVNPMEDGRGNRYQYDPEGQLTDAWYNAVDPAGTYALCLRQDHFNYDPLGNRRGTNYVQTHGWQDFSRKNNGLNQYLMWSPFSLTRYDDDIGGTWGAPQHANGVLMQDGNITAGYNALNQAIMINTAAMGSNWMFFGYDPVGRCVKRWTGNLDSSAPFPWIPPAGSNPATYYYYDGWNLIQEGPNAGYADRQYVHGMRVDEVVAQITPPNNWIRYFHYDASGNCTLQTDTGGGIMEQYEYDAFGYPYFYNASGNNIGYSPWGNRFLFTGREWLNDLKLYDFRNRMYQPELGRFLQPDPKQFAAGDYNLYRYCHNDPINHSDPFGLDTTVVWSNEGNRNQHEPIVVVNGRELTAVTEPALQVTVSAPAANGDVVATVHHIINVRYSDNVGPHNKELQKKEPDHARELDKWRDERGKPKTDFLARHDGPLQGKTPEQVKQMVDHTLRRSFNDAVKETKKHDVPGDHIILHPKGIRY